MPELIPFSSFSADDDSDNNPHDLEGGNGDLEYGTVLLNLQNHQSFTQMQVRVSTKLHESSVRSVEELLRDRYFTFFKTQHTCFTG